MAVSFEGLVVLSVKVFPEDLNVDCHPSQAEMAVGRKAAACR